ncbi:MAG TPA: alpha/beta fold hydrolase [Thermoanaerobaculia bacterium]|nr:alpha/beta fold hydrolase [Thermoanaerobaculia bacterium]
MRKIKAKGRLLGLFAGALAAGLTVEVAARVNVRRERRSRAYLGDRLYFESIGRGRPILLIPGFQGSTRYWQKSVAALGANQQLILIDPLGFGRSPWPDIDYTLEDHLGAIHRTMMSLQLTEPFLILAHSFGCLLATFYASRYPGEVEGLVLMGAPVFRNADDARLRVAAMSPMAAMFALHPWIASESCKVICATRPAVQAFSRWIPSQLPPEVVSDSVLHYWKSVDGTLRNVLFGKSIESALAGIHCPTTFIQGSDDHVTTLDRIHQAASLCGASVRQTGDNHQSYLARSLPIILEELNRAAPQY